MEIRFKKLSPDSVLPESRHENDTGYDLTSIVDTVIPAKGSAIVPIGLQVAYITPGYWYLITPRSGLGFKNGIQPHLGVIDEGYRGSLDVKLYNFSDTDYKVSKGDRVAQLAFFPLIKLTTSFTDVVTDTARGDGGFGHTGK